MDDNLHKQLVFEANRKSVGIAYVLWALLGGFGAHRFYSGKKGTGIAQLALLCSVVGWLVLIPWLLIDIILIPGMVERKNMETIRELDAPDSVADPAIPRKVTTPADRRREDKLQDLRTIGYRKERRDQSHLYR